MEVLYAPGSGSYTTSGSRASTMKRVTLSSLSCERQERCMPFNIAFQERQKEGVVTLGRATSGSHASTMKHIALSLSSCEGRVTISRDFQEREAVLGGRLVYHQRLRANIMLSSLSGTDNSATSISISCSEARISRSQHCCCCHLLHEQHCRQLIRGAHLHATAALLRTSLSHRKQEAHLDALIKRLQPVQLRCALGRNRRRVPAAE